MPIRGFRPVIRGLSLSTILLIASSALAIDITGVTISKNAGHSADVNTNTTGRLVQFTTNLSVLDGGGSALDVVGSTVDALTRYQSIMAVDTGSFNLGQVLATTTDYRVQFTVNAPINVTYDLTIDTNMLGAFTLQDDTALNGPASADISGVMGKINGGINSSLGLSDPTGPTGAGNVNIGTVNQEINSSNSLTVSLMGTQLITLDFSWNSVARSNPADGSSTTTNATNGPFVFGGDEAAIRLGLAATSGSITGGMTADDYPGAGSRIAANDGHFVDISLLVTDIGASLNANLLSIPDAIIDLDLDESLILDASSSMAVGDTINSYIFDVAGTTFDNGVNPVLTLTETQLRAIPGLAAINNAFANPPGLLYTASVTVGTLGGLSDVASAQFTVVPEMGSMSLMAFAAVAIAWGYCRRAAVPRQ
jgi:hypothetical protein